MNITLTKGRLVGHYLLAIITDASPLRITKRGQIVDVCIGGKPPQPAKVVVPATPRPNPEDFGDMRREVRTVGDPFALVGFEAMTKAMFEVIECLLAQCDDIADAYEANEPDYATDGGSYACYVLLRIDPNHHQSLFI